MSSIALPTRTQPARREVATPVQVLEEHRWLLLLVPTFCAAAVFFALTLATGAEWLIGPALIFGPLAMIFAFIYLCISTDAETAG